MNPQTVLDFWFHEAHQPFWFRKSAEFDAQIRAQFLTVWQQAAYSELIVSLLSLYGASAIFLNNFFGRQFWPLGKPLGIFKRG